MPLKLEDEDHRRLRALADDLPIEKRNQLLSVLAELSSVDETGECRMDEPPAKLHLIFDDHGLRYCCTHKKRHSTGRLDRPDNRFGV